ncbi:MAG: VOC family protein [Actinomycetota bacterium]|nr:VOC family protein [Actinomycetota bacterium]
MLDSADFAAIVPVSDIETAVEFYEGKLGLRLVRRRDDDGRGRAAWCEDPDGNIIAVESAGR